MADPIPGLSPDASETLGDVTRELNELAAKRQTGEYIWMEELERERLRIAEGRDVEARELDLRAADIAGAQKMQEIERLNTDQLEERTRALLDTARVEAEQAAERATQEKLTAAERGASPEAIALLDRAEAEAKAAAENAKKAEEALDKAREEYDEKKGKLYEDLKISKGPDKDDPTKEWDDDKKNRFNELKDTLQSNSVGTPEYMAARTEIASYLSDDEMKRLDTQRAELDRNMRRADFAALDSARDTHMSARTSQSRTNLAEATIKHDHVAEKREKVQVAVSEAVGNAAKKTSTQQQAAGASDYQETAKKANEAREVLSAQSVDSFVKRIQPKIDAMYEERKAALLADPAHTDQDIAALDKEKATLMAKLQDKSTKLGGQFQDALAAIEDSNRNATDKDALRKKLLDAAVKADTSGRMPDTFAADFLTANVPEKAPVNMRQLASEIGANPSDITIVQLNRTDAGQDVIQIRVQGDEGGVMRTIDKPAIVNQMRDNGINVNGGNHHMIVMLDAETNVGQGGNQFVMHGTRGHEITLMATGQSNIEGNRAMATMMSNVRSGGNADQSIVRNADIRAQRLELAATEKEANQRIALAQQQQKTLLKVAAAERAEQMVADLQDPNKRAGALAAMEAAKKAHEQQHGVGGHGVARGADPHHGMVANNPGGRGGLGGNDHQHGGANINTARRGGAHLG